VAPNQSTIIGHLHRDFQEVWTTQDVRGVPETHMAAGIPHMSDEESHTDYAGGYPNWQKGFGILDVWEDMRRPRFTLYRPIIHSYGRGRPYFEFNGRKYK
jgi:hypothetical protein